MYYAEKEIFSQFESLKNSAEYIGRHREEIKDFFNDAKKVIFVGSGSSYSIAKSAASITSLRSDIKCIAAPAGDILVNFDNYKRFLDDSIIVSISRSGSTSELIFAVEKAKEEVNCKSIALCARENAEIKSLSDYIIEIPWAFDKSVCQTRTVSNLYAACVMLIAIFNNDSKLESEISKAAGVSEKFQSKYGDLLKKIGCVDFDHGVVLGDCEIAGLAEEGSLAFKEICQINSNHYPVLDVRHGPMVKINETNLVIITAKERNAHLVNLVRDIKSKGAFCLTIGMFKEGMGANWHIELPKFDNMCAAAIYMIFCIQVITFSKAISSGINPDEPTGLEPWINL